LTRRIQRPSRILALMMMQPFGYRADTFCNPAVNTGLLSW
jgi:hypothetical protein